MNSPPQNGPSRTSPSQDGQPHDDQAPPLQRPLPDPAEPDTAPFWRATRDHQLRYQRCDGCRRVVFYPRRHCPRCGSAETTWHTSPGDGTLYSFTVIRQHGVPYFAARTPYVIGFVDLAEGFRMMAEIIGADPGSLAPGMAVSLRWEDHEDLAIPLFAPAAASG